MVTLKEARVDLHSRVERTLQSTLVNKNGVLQRKCWIHFLQIIGVTEQDALELLKEEGSHLSVEGFLHCIFGPTDAQPKAGSASVWGSQFGFGSYGSENGVPSGKLTVCY
eukprot:s3026_g6.t1